MSLIAKKTTNTNNIPVLEAGTYMATTVGVIDIGEQFEKYGKEKEGKYVNEVLFLFEVSQETVNIDGEEKPRWLNKTFTNSVHQKSALYAAIPAWLGRELTQQELDDGFNVSLLLGKPCSIDVRVSKNGEYNDVAKVSGVPKGITVPEPISEFIVFDIDERDDAVFEKLPGWIQRKIKKSTQYQQDLPDEPLENPAAGQAPTPTECPI